MSNPTDPHAAEETAAPVVPSDVLAQYRLASVAGDALLAMVTARDPSYPITDDSRGAMHALALALAAAIARP